MGTSVPTCAASPVLSRSAQFLTRFSPVSHPFLSGSDAGLAKFAALRVRMVGKPWHQWNCGEGCAQVTTSGDKGAYRTLLKLQEAMGSVTFVGAGLGGHTGCRAKRPGCAAVGPPLNSGRSNLFRSMQLRAPIRSGPGPVRSGSCSDPCSFRLRLVYFHASVGVLSGSDWCAPRLRSVLSGSDRCFQAPIGVVTCGLRLV